ncbi:MAG: type 1 glutamine amidotransferase-like domain-containing protein [Acidobacteria bacterium]|nr:type 1 glutamine amidotransferase-like domain-containing protein [Acidobacteriota bacterium]
MHSDQAGPLALVGSGEYLPVMTDFEAGLIAGRSPRYVQIATAAVPDGPATLERWHQLGIVQAQRIGVTPVIVPVATRDDANDPDVVRLVDDAGLIYLSGGNPNFLASTLRDTALWSAIEDQWRRGAALAGCSAGAMVMAAWVPTIRHPREGGTPGLGLLAHLRVIPHFDAFVKRMPDVATRFLVGRDQQVTVVGVDEETAIVGGPEEWVVHGAGSAWVLTGAQRHEFRAGETLRTPLVNLNA